MAEVDLLARRFQNPSWDALDFLAHAGHSSVTALTEVELFVARKLGESGLPSQLQVFSATNPIQDLYGMFTLMNDVDSVFYVAPDDRLNFPQTVERQSLPTPPPPFGTVFPPVEVESSFSAAKPWDWDDEKKVVPLLRPPFTSADYNALADRPDIRFVQVSAADCLTTPLHIRWFFQSLTDLLRQPSLLASAQWTTVTEIDHALGFKSNIRSLLGQLFRHGTLSQIMVAFRVLNHLFRRHDLIEDTGGALPLLRSLRNMPLPPLPPQRRFDIFLALVGASWNMWSWNKERAWQLYMIVLQRCVLPAATGMEPQRQITCSPPPLQWRSGLLRVMVRKRSSKREVEPDEQVATHVQKQRRYMTRSQTDPMDVES